jgi:hypothetical protein
MGTATKCNLSYFKQDFIKLLATSKLMPVSYDPVDPRAQDIKKIGYRLRDANYLPLW